MARAYLKGSNQYLTCTTLPSGVSTFTLSFWLYVGQAAAGTTQSIFNNASVGVGAGIGAGSTEYGLYISATGFGATQNILPCNQWCHVLITETGGSLTLYFNGRNISLEGTVSCPTLGSGTLTLLYNGAVPTSPDMYIAEMGVWSRILTPTEIYDLSSRRHSVALITDSAIALWPLRGTESPEPDVSGNNHSLNARSSVYVEHPDVLDEIPLTLFSPHLTAPASGIAFNRSYVDIEWQESNPASLDSAVDTNYVTYEIQYTDEYIGDKTSWRTICQRLPWGNSSYRWVVGKMVKSRNVRVRIRSKDVLNESVSSWSISETFSVNVFDLAPPTIVSPLEDNIYNDHILVAWDESSIKNTYHQKVRYTLDYSCESLGVDWTTIAANIPVGQNMVRWDVSSVLPAEDYVLRLKARDVSTSQLPTHLPTVDCQDGTETPADQIAVAYVYNIKIRHSGMFIIDTIPPVARISIEGNSRHISNQKRHVINVYAEDVTTRVETVRLSNCDASNYLPLGRLSDIQAAAAVPDSQRCPLDLLIESEEIPFSPKIEYQLNAEESGFQKIMALLSDTGGNLSLHKPTRLFLPFFESTSKITDFCLYQKMQNTWTLSNDTPPQVTSVSESYDIMCVVNEAGEVWVLDPFPRQLYSLAKSIIKVFFYAGQLYFFAHSEVSQGGALTDLTEVYREAGDSVVLVSPSDQLQKDRSIVTAVCEYNSLLWVGFENGELWCYGGAAWMLKTTFDRGIQTMSGDSKFLYIGFQNGSSVVLYNGSTFSTLAV
jgi:hypothetical protein